MTEPTIVKSVRMSAANWAYVAERAKKRETTPNGWISKLVELHRAGLLKEVKAS